MVKSVVETRWNECLYKLFEKVKSEKKDPKIKVKYWKESEKIFEIFKQVSPKFREVTIQDIFDDLHSLITQLYIRGKAAHKWNFQEFKKNIEQRLMTEPVEWNIFFRIGNPYGFKEGYRIIKGRLYSFEKLPKELKNVILMEIPGDLQTDKKWFEDEQIYKERRLKEWFIQIHTKAIGKDKAVERGVNELIKIIAVMKFFRFIRLHTLHSKTPPYDYHILKNSKVISGATFNREETEFIDFFKPLDVFISKINGLKKSSNMNILDNRILECIFTFGNIDNNTPISIRYMLCTIALERLLIGDNESGSKSSLLAERIAFLLGDTKDWYLYYYSVETIHGYNLEGSFTKAHLKEARQALFKKIQNLYYKRSAFAHTGDSEHIIDENYNFASSILLSVVQKLLKLHSKGITRIEADYALLLRWDTVPTTWSSITKYKELQNFLESFEEEARIKNAKVSRDAESKRIYITSSGKKSLMLAPNESGVALIEYDGTPDTVRGRCLAYFEPRKDAGKTFLVVPRDNKSLKEYINNIKFGKAKTYWER